MTMKMTKLRKTSCSAFSSPVRRADFGENVQLAGIPHMGLREVERQTRTLKFALDAHVGMIVESHPILTK